MSKTYLAGKLIEEAAIERRHRVQVVAPATLRDGPWRRFASDLIELRSFEDLISDRRLNPDATGYALDQDPDDYPLIVIDEAHNVRNPATLRAEAFRRLLAGRYRKDLVLLTATPVNNSLWDLYYLMALFLRSDAGPSPPPPRADARAVRALAVRAGRNPSARSAARRPAALRVAEEIRVIPVCLRSNLREDGRQSRRLPRTARRREGRNRCGPAGVGRDGLGRPRRG